MRLRRWDGAVFARCSRTATLPPRATTVSRHRCAVHIARTAMTGRCDHRCDVVGVPRPGLRTTLRSSQHRTGFRRGIPCSPPATPAVRRMRTDEARTLRHRIGAYRSASMMALDAGVRVATSQPRPRRRRCRQKEQCGSGNRATASSSSRACCSAPALPTATCTFDRRATPACADRRRVVSNATQRRPSLAVVLPAEINRSRDAGLPSSLLRECLVAD